MLIHVSVFVLFIYVHVFVLFIYVHRNRLRMVKLLSIIALSCLSLTPAAMQQGVESRIAQRVLHWILTLLALQAIVANYKR